MLPTLKELIGDALKNPSFFQSGANSVVGSELIKQRLNAIKDFFEENNK